jgi:type VI secretion system protein VasG
MAAALQKEPRVSDEIRALVRKLNPICERALQTAAGLSRNQGNYLLDVEHFLLKLLDLPATDVEQICGAFGVEIEQLHRQLTLSIERFDRGRDVLPGFSSRLVRLLAEAWHFSTIQLESSLIRSGGVIFALLEDDSLRETIHESCPVLARVARETLRQHGREIVRHSAEETSSPVTAIATTEKFSEALALPPAAVALERYTIDLTQEARDGKIDPIRGRDAEIRQVIDILMRRRQNNPILVGDAGVGKTAVAEGFALRVASGDVPPPLRKLSVRVLDLGLLQAGTGVKGELEERLKSVIAEVKSAASPVILFIDEAHTLIGDTANLLKPALARGELRTIAATTWSEYKKYFEKDPALARRFQLVKIEEPDEERALDMLRGIAPHLEKHHGVTITDDAVRSCVSLSHRYLTERRLPDKAIGVLDTAAARVALAQEALPPEIEELDRRIRIEVERQASSPVETPTGEDARRSTMILRAERDALHARWTHERELVAKYRSANEEHKAMLRRELDAVQQPEPMVPVSVDARAVAQVVSGWTGIPVGRMLADEVQSILTLHERLAARVVGQPQALDAICRRISTSRAGLEDPSKPKGVFLLVGPTGVGKTETALALADLLYGGERNLISFNMSEFQEAHSVATLKGAPPGYVGYGRGGVLTEAVRRRPWSALLLDEIEKAHPDVVDLFYQVFDKGVLEDGEGVPVDFRHTVILLTSNAGAEVIVDACRERAKPDVNALVEALRPALLRQFRPALLARLVIVPYYPLGMSEIVRIVELKLASVQQRIRENHSAELTYDARLVQSVANRCQPASGAREIDQILTHTLLPELSTRILDRMARGVSFSKIHISVDQYGRFL